MKMDIFEAIGCLLIKYSIPFSILHQKSTCVSLRLSVVAALIKARTPSLLKWSGYTPVDVLVVCTSTSTVLAERTACGANVSQSADALRRYLNTVFIIFNYGAIPIYSLKHIVYISKQNLEPARCSVCNISSRQGSFRNEGMQCPANVP